MTKEKLVYNAENIRSIEFMEGKVKLVFEDGRGSTSQVIMAVNESEKHTIDKLQAMLSVIKNHSKQQEGSI